MTTSPLPYLIGGAVAVVCGLDRTAALQVMLARPLVAAPLTGLLLGDAACGLAIGAVLELLWLSRLPVGASIPHDDTQVAVGATVLTIAGSPHALPEERVGLGLLCLLIALPLGKIGQWCDRRARERNLALHEAALTGVRGGETAIVERNHLAGVLNFALASLLSYCAVVVIGGAALSWLLPVFLPRIAATAPWLRLALILVGVGALLRTLHVKNAFRLFSVAFVLGLLYFWGRG